MSRVSRLVNGRLCLTLYPSKKGSFVRTPRHPCLRPGSATFSTVGGDRFLDGIFRYFVGKNNGARLPH
jgi:hypothetical protein